MPLIRLNPVDVSQYERETKQETLFSCPLYVAGENDQLTVHYIVTYLDLPTDCRDMLPMEKNVRLVCKL